MECARDSESVMELGVNQGTAFILMLLQNPKKMIGVDITTKKWYNGGTYKPLSVLADAYAKKNNIEIEMLEMSSTDKRSTREVDMIHIDSLHTGSHLKKELDLHAQHVKKYIASKSLFFTRPGLTHYVGQRNQLDEASKALFEEIKFGRINLCNALNTIGGVHSEFTIM